MADPTTLSIPSLSQQAPLTVTVLGCGTMGIAILSGILDSLGALRNPSPSGTSTPNAAPLHIPGHDTPTSDLPPRLPTHFIACVKRREGALRVRSAMKAVNLPQDISIDVLERENVKGVQSGDVILLCCKPQLCEEILSAPGMREALRGKVLVSILAGVKIRTLKSLVDEKSTRVVRAMPNTASKIREGMTVISVDDSNGLDGHPRLRTEERALITWMFSQIGKCLVLAEKHMDACTALCGSGPAFYALIVEAMADGGVMMGLPRAEAQMMAAQTMQGAGRMVLRGQHPAIIREQVSTPAGCTIGGLLVLEDGRVRSTIARGIQEATNLAAGLGKK